MQRNSSLLNVIRRRIEPGIVRLKWKIGIKNKRPLRLHLGCGNQHIEGYMNIDFRKTKATNLVCDIAKLPYPDNSVELIETYHVVEHLPRHDLPKVLKEWHRVLTPAGKLIIECPDFDEDVKEYMRGKEKLLDSIFGLQRFPGDSHLFGYNFRRLEKLLKDANFEDIQRREPQDYHAKNEPCLRVECTKEGDKP
ncbi:MAG: methyltransferase domain-containing protein [Promethearchaeota archaeon]